MVVPCRDEATTVAGLLDALAAQTRPSDEVVIVDDVSSDDTAAVVQAWASVHPEIDVRVIAGPGRGAGSAMNVGIAACQADIIVRLDGHCRPHADYIARSLATLGEEVGVAGGAWQIEPGAASRIARGIATVLSHPLGSGGALYRSPGGTAGVRAVDTVPFGTFRRNMWQELRGFDESLLRNQDYDFNNRVRLSGRHVILNPAIVSTYRARASLRTLASQYFDYGVWKIVMLRKFPAAMRLRQFVPIAALPALAGAIAASAISGSAWPLLLPAAYLAVNVAGGSHAALKAGDPGIILPAIAALLTLQLSWTVGAWSSLLRGGRAPR